MKNKSLLWVIPILLVALLAPFTPYLDLTIERYFYALGEGNVEHFVVHPVFEFIYNYGVIPSWIVAIPAMIILVLSYLIKSWKPWRSHALYLVITLAIGAGFIVHAALKDHWGRPRPKQVIEFGGIQEFRPFYEPNFFHQPEPSKSFPCGHCSVGFYFFSLVFLGWRLRKRWITNTGWIVGIGLGIALGITRMAEGGHFFSDVIITALIMWLTALACDWLIYEEMT